MVKVRFKGLIKVFMLRKSIRSVIFSKQFFFNIIIMNIALISTQQISKININYLTVIRNLSRISSLPIKYIPTYKDSTY